MVKISIRDLENYDLVREVVLTRLREDTLWNSFEDILPGFLKYVALDSGDLQVAFAEQVREVLYSLMFQGVITPGCTPPRETMGMSIRQFFYLPYFRITAYGRDVLSAGRLIPHDTDRYITGLLSLGPTCLDSTGVRYLEESLKCFNQGCHLSCVLLLGVAAESVLLRLVDVVRGSPHNPTMGPKGTHPTIRQVHDWLMKVVRSAVEAHREMLPESVEMSLTYLYDLIRRQRNDLGHPQTEPPDVTRGTAFMYLRLFPGFVTDAEAFAQHSLKRDV